MKRFPNSLFTIKMGENLNVIQSILRLLFKQTYYFQHIAQSLIMIPARHSAS